MNNLLCGMIVDGEFYDKYRDRVYTIQGNEYSLKTIETMAGSKRYDTYPQLKEQAQNIVKQVQGEIRKHYAAEDGRKELIMKHSNFSGYLEDLQKIHAKAAPERAALKEKWDEAQERWKADRNDFKDDESYLARQKVKYLDAQENYKNSVAELQRQTRQEIEEVRAEYERHVTDFYAANGNMIDDGIMRLLNSGIKLTDAEIDGMVEKNRSNPTMLRLISDHCEKMKIKNHNAVEFGRIAWKAGADERAAFKAVADMIGNAVGGDEIASGIWSKPDSHFKRLSDEQIGIVNNLPVHPDSGDEQSNKEG